LSTYFQIPHYCVPATFALVIDSIVAGVLTEPCHRIDTSYISPMDCHKENVPIHYPIQKIRPFPLMSCEADSRYKSLSHPSRRRMKTNALQIKSRQSGRGKYW
jgi:hypothetical protein